MTRLLKTEQSNGFLSRFFSTDYLFHNLPGETLCAFNALKKRIVFDRNIDILSPGEQPFFVYILTKGKAQLCLESSTSSYIVRNINENEILGLAESLADFPWKTAIKTVTPCI